MTSETAFLPTQGWPAVTNKEYNFEVIQGETVIHFHRDMCTVCPQHPNFCSPGRPAGPAEGGQGGGTRARTERMPLALEDKHRAIST